jgi:VWFA-related protein
MRWIPISMLLLSLALPSWAAKRMTVAQFGQALAADTAAHKPDQEVARKISGTELSERLTDTTLGRLNQQFSGGSQASAALLLLADRSAFLDPPASELPATPVPDAATQQGLIRAAQKFAVETLPRLPNLLATRNTFSFDDSPQETTRGGYLQRAGMHLIGSSKLEVSAHSERETSAPSTKAEPSKGQGGLTSWGEFGSALLIILSDSGQGKTTWSHWEQTPSGLMAVFHYEVPKAASHYEVDTSVQELHANGQSSRWAGARASDVATVSSWNRMIRSKPAYQGSLWIDPTTGTITRLTLVADLKGNPQFERGAILVEYGPVAIGDKTLICPVRSLALSSAPPTVNTTFDGAATTWLNENLFSGYHLFGSSARILTEKSDVAPAQPSPVERSVTPVEAPSAVSTATSPPEIARAQSSAQENPTQASPPANDSASVPVEPPRSAQTVAPDVATEASVVPKPPANPTPAAPPVQTSAVVAPPPLPDSGVTLRVTVNELLVPVVVRDGQGRAVGDLTKDDFTVRDQGKPLSVNGCTVVRSDAASEVRLNGEKGSAEVSASLPTAAQNRFVIFLFDDRHLETSDLARTQQAALRVLDRPLGPNEYAAVVSLMGVNSGITQDRAVLEAAVGKVSVHRAFHHDTHDCPDIDYYSANKILNEHDQTEFQIAVAEVDGCIGTRGVTSGSSTGVGQIEAPTGADQRLALSAARRALSVGEEDARQSLNAVETVVRAMSKLSGQRTLILMSPGFLTLSPDAMNFKSQLLDQAAASNVVINTMDARGLYAGNVDASQGGSGVFQTQSIGQTALDHLNSMQESENALSEMANGTGGTYIHNNNDLDAGLESLMAPPQVEYLLEISLKDVKPTGTYHALQVKVDRPGVRVQARHGYFAAKQARVANP